MKSLHVDEFEALNNQIRALSGAGISLPAGLRALSGDYPPRIARVSEAIADRLDTGLSLADALHTEAGLPEVYSHVIAAGLRSGRLSAALEGVAHTARQVAALRRLLLVSLVYPIILLFTAYGFGVFLLRTHATQTHAIYRDFDLGPSPFSFYETLRETHEYWAPIPPLVLLLFIAWSWRRLGRSGSWMQFGGGISRVVGLSRVAAALKLLAMLMEHDTPLPEALLLATKASGDRRLAANGRELATAVERGAKHFEPARGGFPPTLQSMLVSGVDRGRMLQVIQRSSDSYARQAERGCHFLSVYIPLLFSTIVGGGATLLLAVFLFFPWFHLLYRMATA